MLTREVKNRILVSKFKKKHRRSFLGRAGRIFEFDRLEKDRRHGWIKNKIFVGTCLLIISTNRQINFACKIFRHWKTELTTYDT